MKQILSTIAFLLLFIIAMGVAGVHDRADAILYPLPVELYQLMRQEIGDDPSDVKVAEYYLAHRKRLDSIRDANGW